ncbi:uncharacterized protein [Cicer arietinum]|uniref:Uncharacterized protein LOC101494879 n=1 Tax=Cicer arietinum TaxID=3827 RepID=A0A3Q7XIH9_CICAR|nr:uncharacterized protein LOC101494879 [Cicer arietinum]
MNSLLHVLNFSDSSGDPETTPMTSSLGLLRFDSGVMLIRITICKSSSSPRSAIPRRIKTFNPRKSQNPKGVIFWIPFREDRKFDFCFSTLIDGKVRAWMYENQTFHVEYDTPGKCSTKMLCSSDGTRLFSYGKSKDGAIQLYKESIYGCW